MIVNKSQIAQMPSFSDNLMNNLDCPSATHTAVSSEDVVNHPKHYTSHPSGVECITITEHYNFNVGNAIKYLWRAGLKGVDTNVQDLQKAKWYIDREIERLKESA